MGRGHPREEQERDKRERDRQTDTWTDTHTQRQAGGGERGERGGRGGTRIAVLGWARRLRGACPGRRGCRRGAGHQSRAQQPGAGPGGAALLREGGSPHPSPCAHLCRWWHCHRSYEATLLLAMTKRARAKAAPHGAREECTSGKKPPEKG